MGHLERGVSKNETVMEIKLGIMAPPLSVQLRKSRVDKEKVKEFQRDMEAIIRLYMRGVLCETLKNRAYRGLERKIRAEIKRVNDSVE